MDTKFFSGDKRQTRLFLLVFGGLVLALALGYYLFLRTDYAVLYANMRPADASAVVAELKEQAIDYQLRDDGTTILVPAEEAPSVRLAIVGSDVPLKGMVGFELFNKSDMGLTDFAQKINYQRALQGELSRTIMMMDGVENARVHLALPDRSLFRGDRSEPKAAVTVTATRGASLGEARVTGMQRLVAAAVPDLALSDVVVLDDMGRVISRSLETESLLAPEAEERSAVQHYYRARIRAAVANVVRGQAFDVRLLVVPMPGATLGEVSEKKPGAESARDFQLRILIVTSAALNPEDQELIRNAVVSAIGLREEIGDSLAFDVESALMPPNASPVQDAVAPVEPIAAQERPDPDSISSVWSQSWWIALIFLLAGLIMFGRRSGEREVPAGENNDLIQRIRRQIGAEGEGDAAA